MCFVQERLCSSLEISNAVGHLVLGDLYQAHNLKRMALQFVVSTHYLLSCNTFNKLLCGY